MKICGNRHITVSFGVSEVVKCIVGTKVVREIGIRINVEASLCLPLLVHHRHTISFGDSSGVKLVTRIGRCQQHSSNFCLADSAF